MKNIVRFLVLFVFGYTGQVFSKVDGLQRALYQKHFAEKVYKFANKNRFNSGNINHDKYVNCYMQVGIEVTVAADGSVRRLTVKNPSLVPMIDKYFSYVAKQAAPFPPLEKYFADGLSELTFIEKFTLKVNLYEHSKVTKPCS